MVVLITSIRLILCILLTFILYLIITYQDSHIGKKILFLIYVLVIILIFNFSIKTEKCTVENVYSTDNEEAALGFANTHRHYVIKDSNDKLYDICTNGFRAATGIGNSINPKKAKIDYIKIGNVKMVFSYYIE